MDSAIANCIEQLQGSDPAARRGAAEKLAQLGPDAAPAAIELVRACADSDEGLREWSVAALEGLEAPRTADVPALAKLLSHENSLAAYWAATLLGRLESQAAPAVAELATALDAGRDLSLRERTAWALGRIGPAAKAALPALQQAASGGEPRLARLAEEAIASVT
jgi:hypothetical protein